MFKRNEASGNLFEKNFVNVDCVYVMLDQTMFYLSTSQNEVDIYNKIGFSKYRSDVVAAWPLYTWWSNDKDDKRRHLRIFSTYSLAALAAMLSKNITPDGVPLVGKLSVEELMRCLYQKVKCHDLYAITLDDNHSIDTKDLLTEYGFSDEDEKWMNLDQMTVMEMSNPYANLFYGLRLCTKQSEWKEIIQMAHESKTEFSKESFEKSIDMIRLYMKFLPEWYVPCDSIPDKEFELNTRNAIYDHYNDGWIIYGDQEKAEKYATENDCYLVHIQPENYDKLLKSSITQDCPATISLDYDQDKEALVIPTYKLI